MVSHNVNVYPEVTEPIYAEKALQLVSILKKYDIQKLSKLLNISHNIAQTNYERYQTFLTDVSDKNALPAIYSYAGDAYTSLDAGHFTKENIEFAQKHVRILSGLYGYLRPLDLIQPYRLEMATKMKVGKSTNLYDFWKNSIRNSVKRELEEQKTNIIFNLASNEYFRALDLKTIDCKIVTPIFLDEVNGKHKIVSIFAKKARGLMTAFIIKNKLDTPEYLNTFHEDRYIFNHNLSNRYNPVFTR
jgi:hypothetical protein